MRKAIWTVVVGAALSSLAWAQGPSFSNQIPPGFTPGGGDVITGNGCPCIAGTPEGEANCGLPTDTVNGGCNSAPNVFSSIALDESVCGTAEWNVTVPGFRDTDWYEYTVTTPGTYNWQVDSEFPALIAVIDAAGGCPPSVILGFANNTGCGDTSVLTFDLQPGTYWFFVAPDFSGPPATCGTEYTATLWADLPAQAIPAVGQIGLAAIAVLLAGLAFYVLRRRRVAAA